jgi:hypothetical protein
MKRLPGIENGSRGAETAVFSSLALAGLAAIALAIASFVNFVDGSDRVVLALTGKPAPACPAPCCAGGARTNVTSLETKSPVTPPPNKV